MKISKVFIGHGDNSFKVRWGGGGTWYVWTLLEGALGVIKYVWDLSVLD